ncbi:hypothetical protein GYMLUDRAFT_86742 [Collybiopsis luxurians FD-317 M1]|uniref:Uncharacterized protein n=1 Tax=Collybiopsis luxurians FD-317 M1 TaxID=944289 RepID=A0A0D0CH54_9AGAR|nr:hypothetical protein GYMLUDRAFT_86742 [Collybiopsis luxurians FD-317 M1]
MPTLIPPSSSQSVKEAPTTVSKATGVHYSSLENALANSISYNNAPENLYHGITPSKRSSTKRSRSEVNGPARKRLRYGDEEEGHKPGSWILIKVPNQILIPLSESGQDIQVTGKEEQDQVEDEDLIRLYVVGPTGYFVPPPQTASDDQPSFAQYLESAFSARKANIRFVKKRADDVASKSPSQSKKTAGEDVAMAEDSSTIGDRPVFVDVATPDKLRPRQGWLSTALRSSKRRSGPRPFVSSDFSLPRIRPGCFLPRETESGSGEVGESGVDLPAVRNDADLTDFSEAGGYDENTEDVDADINPTPAVPVPAAQVEIAVLDDKGDDTDDADARVDQLIEDENHQEQPAPSVLSEATASSRPKRTPRKPTHQVTPLTASTSISSSATRTSARRIATAKPSSPAKPTTPKTKPKSKTTAVRSSGRTRSTKTTVEEPPDAPNDIQGTVEKEGLIQDSTGIDEQGESSKSTSGRAGKAKKAEVNEKEAMDQEGASQEIVSSANGSARKATAKGKGKGKQKKAQPESASLTPDSTKPETVAASSSIGISPTVPSTSNHFGQLSLNPPSHPSTSTPSTSFSPTDPSVFTSASLSAPTTTSTALVPQTYRPIDPNLPLPVQFQQSAPVIAALPPAMQSYLLMALLHGTGHLPPAFLSPGANAAGSAGAGAPAPSNNPHTAPSRGAHGFGAPGPLLSSASAPPSPSPPTSSQYQRKPYSYSGYPPPQVPTRVDPPPPPSQSTTSYLYRGSPAAPAPTHVDSHPIPSQSTATYLHLAPPGVSITTTAAGASPVSFQTVASIVPSSSQVPGAESISSAVPVNGQGRAHGQRSSTTTMTSTTTTAKAKKPPKSKKLTDNAAAKHANAGASASSTATGNDAVNGKRKGPIVKLGTGRKDLSNGEPLPPTASGSAPAAGEVEGGGGGEVPYGATLQTLVNGAEDADGEADADAEGEVDLDIYAPYVVDINSGVYGPI